MVSLILRENKIITNGTLTSIPLTLPPDTIEISNISVGVATTQSPTIIVRVIFITQEDGDGNVIQGKTIFFDYIRYATSLQFDGYFPYVIDCDIKDFNIKKVRADFLYKSTATTPYIGVLELTAKTREVK